MRKSIFLPLIMSALLISCASNSGTSSDKSKAVPAKLDYTPTTENCRLSDPKATDNAKKLYNFICDMYGKKVISGMMENAWDDSYKELDAVKESTGKYPALMGFDFMNYTGMGWAVQNQQTTRAMNFYDGLDYSGKKIADGHGIIAFNWHWRDPMAPKGTNGSFRPEEAAFRIPYDTDTKQWKTDTEEYKKMMADMDVIAKQLGILQSLGIPVIWRPLHEGAGNVGLYGNSGKAWFWWGAGNTTKYNSATKKYSVSTNEAVCAECYIALWRLMYDYFTQTKKLHNLIWLWNGQNAKFYPGAEYVDMIGNDIYAHSGDYSSQKAAFTKYQAMDPDKPVALSECGIIPSPTNMLSDGAMWSYFMVWNDGKKTFDKENYWNGPNNNPDDHKLEVYNSPLVITLDQMPF